MILHMSSLFLRTLREDPVDAEVPSHRLLVRAGYIRRISPGIYTWLPLGLRVLRNVERVVREEMDAIGAQELIFPALLPREPYEASGRWSEYGDNIFRLKDRKGGDYLLGPTHEEVFTLTVKDLYSSYKDLPLALYQLDAAYQKHRDAYIRIFDRLGFDYVIVKAMAGAMGGSKSEEFLATAENGEDTYVRTADGSYAANVEAVIVPQAPPVDYADAPAAHVEDTPDTPTIETLVAVANANHPRTDGRAWTAADTLKNVIVVLVSPDGTREPLAIGLPGDRDVDLKRLEAQVAPAEIEAFDEKDFATHPGLVKGYIGPGALGEAGTTGIRYLLDPRVGVGSAWVTGANEPGRHVFHLVHGRDFEADGTVQAAEVRDGDEAPDGSGPLESARGIEMGHIFQLGTKYAEALDLKVLDQNGKLVTVTMGSYGVGVSRAVGCVAEGNHDEFGLIWPRELSPVDVHIVATGKDTAVHAKAEEIASALEAQGISSIVDDRWQASPGVKFKDAELIGVPTIVVVGKGLANGVIEIKDRRTAERREIDADGIVAAIVTEVRGT